MAQNKTAPTDGSVQAFLQTVDEKRRADCDALLALMQDVTGEPPVMWGASMIGFGSYHYTYASGREGDSFVVGFAPRKQNLVLYIMAGFEQYDALLARLGKHTTGKACLYIKRLADVDQAVLRELVSQSVAYMRASYG